MARKRKKAGNDRKKRILGGALLFVLAALVLVALVAHTEGDDRRITGETDPQLNPFEISYQNQAGMVGAYFSFLLFNLMGWLACFVPLGLLFLSLRVLASTIALRFEPHTFLLFVISLLGTMIYDIHLFSSDITITLPLAAGGLLAASLTGLVVKVAGQTGSYLVLIAAIVVLVLTYTSLTPLLSKLVAIPGLEYLRRAYLGVSGMIARLFVSRSKDSDSAEDEDDESVSDEALQSSIPDAEPAVLEQSELDLPGEERVTKKQAKSRTTIKRLAEPVQIKSFEYKYPPLDLLTTNPNPGTAVASDELAMTARMLQETLETFNIKIEGQIEKYPGPVITRYEFKPAAGIKVNQILGLSDDLALALKAKRIRIIAPIPGKAAVGVEIPNRNPQTVYARDIFESEEFNNPAIRLPLAMGKNTAGKPFVADLTKMPHLLIAGATGSGKSVCMNMLITSLLYRLHPYQVRFVFIDPKMLELSIYSGIPHLGRPVVTKPKGAERVLSDIVNEMENRYRRFAAASVRNIEDYNRKQPTEETKQPYIVVFVDELADLMMSSTSTKTEMLITRLAQMARAVGIHLILATQRPSVDVITGLIKANFPARVAFQVASKVDSRTIIDGNGAEKLLGSGDMLYLSTGQPEPMRVHGAYLSSEETERIVAFINEQGIPMLALEGISQSSEDAPESEVDVADPLFREACEVVIRHKQGSVSLLQRRLGIGYQRAARLIDKLEQAGVVSPFDGSKAREVIVDKSYLDNLGGKAVRQPAGDAQ